MIRDALASPIVRSRVSSGIGQQMIKKAVVTFPTELMTGNTEESLCERLQEAIAYQLVSLGTARYQLVSVGTVAPLGSSPPDHLSKSHDRFRGDLVS